MTIDPKAVAALIDHGFHSVVFQPVRRLACNSVVGYEALMRGPAGTPMAMPGPLFGDARLDRDLLHRLDLACLLSAVRLGRVFGPEQILFLNMHGETLVRLTHSRGDVEALLEQLNMDVGRIVLEVSELTDGSHVRAIGRSLKTFRQAGLRIALDDVGARSAWLHHVMWLEPEILKIDLQFIRRIDKVARKRRVVESLVRLCKETGSEVVAEGIETEGERAVLLEIGVSLGQGYLLGRPQPIQAWMPATEEMARRTRVAGLVTIGGMSA